MEPPYFEPQRTRYRYLEPAGKIVWIIESSNHGEFELWRVQFEFEGIQIIESWVQIRRILNLIPLTPPNLRLREHSASLNY